MTTLIIIALIVINAYLFYKNRERSGLVQDWIICVNNCEEDHFNRDCVIEMLSKINRGNRPEKPINPEVCCDICGEDEDGV